MTDDTLNAEIDRQVEAAMEKHNLKQIAKRLLDMRDDVKMLCRFEPLPPAVADDLANLANRIEDSMWRIEKMLNPNIP